MCLASLLNTIGAFTISSASITPSWFVSSSANNGGIGPGPSSSPRPRCGGGASRGPRASRGGRGPDVLSEGGGPPGGWPKAEMVAKPRAAIKMDRLIFFIFF